MLTDLLHIVSDLMQHLTDMAQIAISLLRIGQTETHKALCLPHFFHFPRRQAVILIIRIIRAE